MKDSLGKYHEKRKAGQTPEPTGSVGESQPRFGHFVVQMHNARRLHFDLRLEVNGVLKSWAVPRGPSMSPKDKRLAVFVEDHPLEYAWFEGVIPEGNYGAGQVIVWDYGTYKTEGDAGEQLKNGEIKFELSGFKLAGKYTLVKTGGRSGRAENEWLLIKKTDRFSSEEKSTDDLPAQSVLSGLLVTDIGMEREREEVLKNSLLDMGGKEGTLNLFEINPPLCTPLSQAFNSPEHLYELKYDGYRLLAQKCDDVVTLRYRSGRDATKMFPDLVRVLGKLPVSEFVVDGEVVVLDEEGVPHFHLLQKRTQKKTTLEIGFASKQYPATLVLFDLLSLCKRDLRALSLVERKSALRALLPPVGPVKYCDHIEERGIDFFNIVVQRGLEGVVAKKRSSKYVEGRTEYWQKIRQTFTDEFAVVGLTAPTGERQGFGALMLAERVDGTWEYRGRCGTGFSGGDLESLSEKIGRLQDWDEGTYGGFPASDGLPSEYQRVEPVVFVTVEYKNKTPDGRLRMARYRGLAQEGLPAEPADIEISTVDATVETTNPAKVFWPEEGLTKDDLVQYYRQVAPYALPYFRDRPIVLTRYPNGIYGESFFQKDAPAWVPSWVRTESTWSDDDKETRAFVLESPEAFAYVGNLGAILLHAWSSRTATLSTPDWVIVDLDPKEAPFSSVVACALAFKELADEFGIPCYVKTTGSTGLHVLIPLGGQCTHRQAKDFARVLCTLLLPRVQDIATMERTISKRGEKVYLDWGQNGHGRLIAAPFTARAVPEASVSMPVSWSEVTKTLSPRQFTVKNALRFLDDRKEDPWDGILRKHFDLSQVVERLIQSQTGSP